MKLTLTNQPDPSDDAAIAAGVRRHNRQFTPSSSEPLSVYLRDEQGELIAGLTGKTSGNWLHINFLWVSESQRHLGLGSQVLQAAEREASKRGCIGATLDTFSFQALDFYLKQGYREFGSLEGYSGRFKRHYLQKPLVDNIASDSE